MTTEAPPKPRARRAKAEPEIIPGEVVDEVQLPAVREQTTFDAGTMALALLSDEDFSERLTVLRKGRERIQTIQRELLVLDEDYGIIPNTKKPTLFKPGAEKLCQFYRLAARLEVELTAGDNEHTPPLIYSASCFLHLGSTDGPVVATGHGTANSWEKRYIRGGDKKCPTCGAAAIIKSKFEPGWFCFPKKGGCGAKYGPKDDAIIGQQEDAKGDAVGAWDLGVTLMKMAEKRAFVDATLRATATSGLFTQDVVPDPRDDEDAVTDSTGAVVTTPGGARVDAETGDIVGRETVDEGAPGEPIPVAAEPATLIDETGHRVPADTVAIGNRADAAEPEPEIRPSAVPDVGRGGSTPNANSAQIKQTQELSMSLHLGPFGLTQKLMDLELLDEARGLAILDMDKPLAAVGLMRALEALTSDQIGTLISKLRQQVESAP